MKYKSVLLTKRGGPDVLKVIENEIRVPEKNEVLIKIQSCGVGLTDVAMRNGYYPYAPKIPFIPGYEIVGTIESTGNEVSAFKVGDSVASLTVYGGYSEYIYLNTEDLVKVPEGLNSDKAVAIILNYTTAYQMLIRLTNVREGDKVLITGASGGVGSALVDLGKYFKLKMYGTASVNKHRELLQKGVTPIDYRTEDFVKFIHNKEPKGLDYVFDGIGGSFIDKSFSLLRKGGKLVEYGYPSYSGMIKGFIKILLLNFLPNGRKSEFYGISGSYKKNREIILKDITFLFQLLEENKIEPLIYKKMTLLEAADANRLLESGEVVGKIVLTRND